MTFSAAESHLLVQRCSAEDRIVDERYGQAEMCEREAMMQLVSFKWLMSCVGWAVDVRRIQVEPAYADSCLQRAAASDLDILRRRSVELRDWLVRRPEEEQRRASPLT